MKLESFVGFVPCDDKTGAGIAEKLCTILQEEGLSLNFDLMRGPGYDNGANMAGIYNGVQALIKKQNAAASYITCAAHSLNLAGVHAASVNHRMVSFFGTVEKFFTFFAASTSRWQILTNKLNISLKSHSDTRWCSKANAVKALVTQLPELIEAAEENATSSHDSNTVSTADGLHNSINFNFICLLRFWWEILSRINMVNVSVQYQKQSLDNVCTLVDGLQVSLSTIRENFDETVVNSSKPVAQALGISDSLQEKRVRKVKRQSDEKTEDESRLLNALDQFRQECFMVLDCVIAEIRKRFDATQTICSNFRMILPKHLKAAELDEISSSAHNLCSVYKNDLSPADFNLELIALKTWLPTILGQEYEKASPLELLNSIMKFGMQSAFVNVCIAIRVFLTLPVTVASAERSFSKLKLIKNYMRSKIGQERLSSLAILSIEYDIAKSIDYADVIDRFAQTKARKVKL